MIAAGLDRPNQLEADAELKRDAVYERLLLDIICGELATGEIVDEASLAQRYDTGRAGIRDALFRLALEGLIDRRPRLGSVVANASFEELQQVFELRLQLEGQCADLAARNARKSEVEAIKRAFVNAEELIEREDWRGIVVRDRQFHQALAAASHNGWLARTLANLHQSSLRFWHYALPRRGAAAVKREIVYHRRVAAAIEAHDSVAAQAAMRAVLGEFPATVQGLFSNALERRR